MNFRSEKFLLWFSITLISLLYFLVAIFSEGTYDSGDGIQHYLISRYSWKHPELFLHLWGKPFFTLVSSPFSQFGLFGANIFNIFCAAATSLLCYRIARELDMANPLLVIPFFCFAPIYFGVIQSGLTEPFFGFVLILGIYLFILKKYGWASMIISFLPFVRTEGNMILPLFMIMLFCRRKFWAIPFALLGTFVFTIAGYFYYGDWLWLIHQNPYNGKADLYGNGTIYHFLIREEFIWGTPLFLLFCAGCLWFAFSFFKMVNDKWPYLLKNKISSIVQNRISLNSFLRWEELVLVGGSFFIYFLAHTFFWWQGIFSSLGLIRVMAGVMPLGALISLRGFNFLFPFFQAGKISRIKILFISLGCIALVCFFHNRSILRLNKEDVEIKKAADWIKDSEFKGRKIFYLHPYFSLALNLDRFDRKSNGEIWALEPQHPESGMSSGNVLLWDAHFGPNEGGVKLERLVNNSSFKLINKFVPEKEFTVLGGNNFEVYVFERK